jgi:hypothetical protein
MIRAIGTIKPNSDQKCAYLTGPAVRPWIRGSRTPRGRGTCRGFEEARLLVLDVVVESVKNGGRRSNHQPNTEHEGCHLARECWRSGCDISSLSKNGQY